VLIEVHKQFYSSGFSCGQGFVQKSAYLELEVGKGLLDLVRVLIAEDELGFESHCLLIFDVNLE
jgi:hypothetical protein